MLLKIVWTFRDQPICSTANVVPGFMATCCHAKPLLAVPKAQKASLTIRTSENGTLESIMNSYFKPITNATMNCSTGILSGYAGVTSLCSKLDFTEKVYQKLSWLPLSPPLSGVIREPAATEWLRLSSLNFVWNTCWHFIAARITWEEHDSLCSSSYLENYGHTRHQHNFLG